MKFSYTHSEVEAWRDKVHRKTTRLAVKTKAQAFDFIQEVGYCFAFNAEDSESPCLWAASTRNRIPSLPYKSQDDPFLRFLGEMKGMLPAKQKIYYGRLLQNRPTVVSLEYFPYFYALSRRSGSSDEYVREFAKGNISSASKAIMDALSDSAPQVTNGLRLASGLHNKADRKEFDRAITDLQRKMFIVKTAEHNGPFSVEWDTVLRRFPKETRKSRSISEDEARQMILQKYFQNQLVGTVASIHRLFGWDKQLIFRTLGRLKNAGVVTPDIMVDGKDDKYYGLVC